MGENSITTIIDSLLIIGKAPKFYSFSNADGKRWIMPALNMATAMELYQPSGVKGKLMKALFPYFHFITPIRLKLGATAFHYNLCEELKNLLEDMFQVSDIEFSLFCGTPSVHQKITMQISCKDKILGYCKFSNNPEIKDIFKREQSVLDNLHQNGMKNIPQCLYCGPIKDNIDIFIQTTSKTKDSKITHEITKLHLDFLSEMREKTMHRVNYEESNFYQILIFFSSIVENLPEDDCKMIIKAINKVNEYYKGRHVDFCMYHGDFTPWNMFVEQGQLFVFDWEYVQFSFPPYMDVFHLISQIAILEQGLNSEETFHYYNKNKPIISKYIQNIDFYYLCYLLAILSFYFKINNGRFSTEDRSYKCWIGLVKILLYKKLI